MRALLFPLLILTLCAATPHVEWKPRKTGLTQRPLKIVATEKHPDGSYSVTWEDIKTKEQWIEHNARIYRKR